MSTSGVRKAHTTQKSNTTKRSFSTRSGFPAVKSVRASCATKNAPTTSASATTRDGRMLSAGMPNHGMSSRAWQRVPQITRKAPEITRAPPSIPNALSAAHAAHSLRKMTTSTARGLAILCMATLACAGAAHPQRAPGARFRDCTGCPEMVVIPAGSFVMGSSDAEKAWAVTQGAHPDSVSDEAPQHTVTIRSFALGRYDVTRAEFAAFAKETGFRPEPGCRENGNPDAANRPTATWEHPGFEQTDREPVICVSWNDAKAFIAWLNDKVLACGAASAPYRLPTEAEWEFFLLQPLLENAIEHGKSDTGTTSITLSAALEHDMLRITLVDDGPGVAADGPAREGIGLTNTRARLTHLYGPRGTVELGAARGGPGSPGTRVEIRIPIREAAR